MVGFVWVRVPAWGKRFQFMNLGGGWGHKHSVYSGDDGDEYTYLGNLWPEFVLLSPWALCSAEKVRGGHRISFFLPWRSHHLFSLWKSQIKISESLELPQLIWHSWEAELFIFPTDSFSSGKKRRRKKNQKPSFPAKNEFGGPFSTIIELNMFSLCSYKQFILKSVVGLFSAAKLTPAFGFSSLPGFHKEREREKKKKTTYL